MTHNRKYATVCKLNSWSRYPSTWSAIINSIPADVWDTYTAAQIASMIDIMQASYNAGKVHQAAHPDY